jgi:flagellar basal-body rod protein FlgG
MIQSLYAGSSGMEAQQLSLNTIANNLANANTNGFKRSKIEFQDLLYQRPRTAGAETGNGNLLPTGVELGNGSRVVATAKIFTQGQLRQTGGSLDLAIEGNGFFRITRPDGTDAYTRDGSLKVSSAGTLVTNDGLVVPGPSGFDQYKDIGITPNGNINGVNIRTGRVEQFSQMPLTFFPNPAGLRSLGGNLYEETPSSGQAQIGVPGQNGVGTLVQGFLESSNVNVVEEMVNMIQAQRAYEINSRAITTSDEMLGQLAQLKR